MVATDLGVPTPLSAAIRVTVLILRNRNGPVFQAAEYTTTINEYVQVGTSILNVRATDADNVRILY